MTTTSRSIVVLALWALGLAGCSNAEFSVASKTARGNSDSGSPDDEPSDHGKAATDRGTNQPGADGTPGTDDDGSDPKGGVDGDTDESDDILTEEERKIRRSRCWFAVSGAYMGDGSYGSVFPGTTSGNPIGHGETFDTVGGVYLAARPEPYAHGQGGGEIDLAVARTFDSIAVAPGMRAQIKDPNGNVLYEQDGPSFVLSSDYGEHAIIVAARAHYRANVASYPEWMQKILKDKDFSPERKPLHAAGSVQVSRLPGGYCDFD